MKKHFCDLCEQPASEEKLNADIHFGKSWRDARGNQWQSLILATVEFETRLCESGSVDPPDLCMSCKLKLVKQIVSEHERH